MSRGAGKYDEACTAAREATRGQAVALIVVAGRRGSGFSVQCDDRQFLQVLPDVLRVMADQIEADNACEPDAAPRV